MIYPLLGILPSIFEGPEHDFEGKIPSVSLGNPCYSVEVQLQKSLQWVPTVSFIVDTSGIARLDLFTAHSGKILKTKPRITSKI